MPFINEKLSANQELIEEQKAKSTQQAFASRFRFKPEKVMTDLRAKIIGQEQVLAALEDLLYLVKADFGEKQKPLAIYFLMGPTGVGKTETVKLLAEALLGDRQRLCQIDMNTLSQEHYAAALIGAPPGYVGSKEGHSLFDPQLIAGSYSQPSVVLFDEVEKASPQVIRTLLNIFDNGKLILPSGQCEIDFTNSLIFLTSNVGSNAVSQARKNFVKSWRGKLGFGFTKAEAITQQYLEKTFDPELINRFDRILTYKEINSKSLSAVIDVFVDDINQRLMTKGVSIAVDLSAKQQLYSFYNKNYGVRDIKRHFRHQIEPLLAKTMLNNQFSSNYFIGFKGNDFYIYRK
jgi:ATP-dependent Clp protease ATP-binding subunit ClpA